MTRQTYVVKPPAPPREIDIELATAVEKDDAAAVEEALDKGGNPNALVGGTRVPIIFMVRCRSRAHEKSDVMDLLLRYGGEPESSYRGKTLLHTYLDMKAGGVVDQILCAGADPFRVDQHDLRPIEKANASDEVSCMKAVSDATKMPFLRIDERLTHAKVMAMANEEDGFYPLDNPRMWRQFGEIMDQLEANGEPPITKADLRKLGGYAQSFMTQAVKCYALGVVLDAMGRHGEGLTVDDIRTETGEPTRFLQQVMEKGQVRQLFQPALWTNSTLEDVQAFHAALPPEAQREATNYPMLRLEKEDEQCQVAQALKPSFARRS